MLAVWDAVAKIEGKVAVDDIVYPSSSDRAGEVILEGGQKITKNIAEIICTSGLSAVEVMPEPKSPLIFNSLADDATSSHEEALLLVERLACGEIKDIRAIPNRQGRTKPRGKHDELA